MQQYFESFLYLRLRSPCFRKGGCRCSACVDLQVGPGPGRGRGPCGRSDEA